MSTPGSTLPNPTRSRIQEGLPQLPPEPSETSGIYGLTQRYDRRRVLARLPGDDLHAISASATADAAAHAKSGTIFLAWAVPSWFAGVGYLLVQDAPMTAIAVLAVGTLGIAVGARQFTRANHDRLLMHELGQLFATDGDAG